MTIFLILFYFNLNEIRCEAPSRWDISDCPQRVIEAETRERTIVSRSYPTSFGNHWYCKYNIQSPDNTKKILVEFTFFYLTEAQYNENQEDEDYGELVCNFQNVTLSG